MTGFLGFELVQRRPSPHAEQRGAQAVSRAAKPPKGTLDAAEHRGLMSNRRPSCDRPIHSWSSRDSRFVRDACVGVLSSADRCDTSRSNARGSFTLSSV